MFSKKTKIGAGIALAFAGALAFSACSSTPSASTGESTPAMTEESSPSMTPMETDSAMDPTATLVGSGCQAYADAVPSGAGSVEGMALDPVATAASNNPLLTTLVAAVSGKLNPDVNLVDTLNSGEFTVFAPVDDAFKKVDAATLETLKSDSALLTTILTYHVLPERLDPADIVGTHTTVAGPTLEVAGSGDNLTVNGANVICGGVQTANATVYLIDSVLTPPAS